MTSKGKGQLSKTQRYYCGQGDLGLYCGIVLRKRVTTEFLPKCRVIHGDAGMSRCRSVRASSSAGVSEWGRALCVIFRVFVWGI